MVHALQGIWHSEAARPAWAWRVPSAQHTLWQPSTVASRWQSASSDGSAERHGQSNDTPAPGYYDTLCSKGKEHKLGRYDQASAPKFTMRKKTAFGDIKFSGTEPTGDISAKYDTVMNA